MGEQGGRNDSTAAGIPNAATRAVVATLGVLVGVGSIDHGLLECMQGNRPTPGLILNALGPGYSWTLWKQGGEGAFTLVPDFLLTGILATLMGVALIWWSLRRIQRRHGPAVFLLLGVGSFLVGGGVAQVVLFTLTWAAATRIRGSLRFWRRLMPAAVRQALGGAWRWSVVAGTVLFLAALEMAVVGYVPGITSQIRILHVCWTILALALGLFLLALVAGFAHDIEARAGLDQEA